ncbi:hypothetical protein T4B_3321 [Trichinella pseudospiralis]|uniref:Uncharacterized protein n=1 Tax=Trichinella pseudospiralis TaxID=6337 RepID=A0A0V1GM00_TRIPS|nr:hypothetical protein T4B_3321 [Trichinella pseudospiralis]
MEEEFLGGLHHAPEQISKAAPSLPKCQQSCSDGTAPGWEKRWRSSKEKIVWKLNRCHLAERREEFVGENTCTLENNRASLWFREEESWVQYKNGVQFCGRKALYQSKCPQCCFEIAEQDVEKACTVVGRKQLQSSQNVGLVQAKNKTILDNRKSGYGKITAAMWRK